MVYFIGDVHGEITKLKALIEIISFKDSNPTFVFVGDYIDKGENSKKTLHYLQNLQYESHFVIGNHEYYWLTFTDRDSDIQSYLLRYGGTKTIKSFDCENIEETQTIIKSEFGNFLSKLVPYYFYKNFIVVHSGLNPLHFSTDINKIEISDLLFNRYDFLKMQVKYKDSYTIVFGHTAFYSPYYDGCKIGVDTGACFIKSQPLTAFNADILEFVNSNGNTQKLSSLNLNISPNIIRKNNFN